MDSQVTFDAWYEAVKDGRLDEATQHQENYNSWIKRGGFPAEDYGDERITILDQEQDRYLVDDKWRAVD